MTRSQEITSTGKAGNAATSGTDRRAAREEHDVLPDGMRVELDRRVRRLVGVDGGVALLGGTPPRVMHLASAARQVLDGERPHGPAGRSAFTVVDPVSRRLARLLLDAGMAHPAQPIPDAAGTCDVTVVIPVKDRPLGRLLATLTGEVGELGGLIVVDDGSADPDAVRTEAMAHGCLLIRHPTARGPAAARNAGLGAATTPLVAFLDSDVVPQPGWLAPLLGHFADPAVAVVAPRIVALHPVSGLVGRYEAVRSSLDLGPDPALIVPRSRVAYVPSAALVVRREIVAGLGGFDAGMHVAEDVDLVLRLYAAGHRLRYEPAARVAHDHRTDPAAWLRRKAFYGTGAAPLARRHEGQVPPMVLSPWSAVACAALLAQHRWSLPVAGVLAAAATVGLARKMPRLARPRAAGARLAGLGLLGAVSQMGSAILRHLWPVAAVLAPFSRRVRRAVAAAALAEGLLDWWNHCDRDPGVRIGPLEYLLAHRLDDLAYGIGLWWGAWRSRTLAPLLPSGPRAGQVVSVRPSANRPSGLARTGD